MKTHDSKFHGNQVVKVADRKSRYFDQVGVVRLIRWTHRGIKYQLWFMGYKHEGPATFWQNQLVTA